MSGQIDVVASQIAVYQKWRSPVKILYNNESGSWVWAVAVVAS
jgi:hypothetical protein